MKKHINQILEYCEINTKAIVVIENLNHFLKTEQDCAKFLHEFETRQLWRVKDNGLALMKLAEEVGAYHYQEKTLDELLIMDDKEALEILFLEPINHGKLFRFKEHKASITDLFWIKKQQPTTKLMTALLYV